MDRFRTTLMLAFPSLQAMILAQEMTAYKQPYKGAPVDESIVLLAPDCARRFRHSTELRLIGATSFNQIHCASA